jgi:DNA-directed RNA polymerase subunit RPC12/RpoP
MRGQELKTSSIVQSKAKFSYLLIICLLLNLLSLSVILISPGTIYAAPIPEDEPNDSFAQSMVITSGSYSGEVDSVDMVDYYNITLGAGERISVEYTTNATGNETALVLFNGNHIELWNSSWVGHDTTTWLNYTINQTVLNPYYLAVMAQVNGNLYEFTLSISAQNDRHTNNDAGDSLATATEIAGGTLPGYLADEDKSDYYKFTVADGAIFDVNFSVSALGTVDVNFELINNEPTTIKAVPNLSPGSFDTYQVTTNGTGERTFYISAIITSGMINYEIKLDVNYQDDATSGGDAGDNLSAPVKLTDEGVLYTGNLGAGVFGDDHTDAYELTIPTITKEYNVNITFTPDSSLDITLNVYNDSYGQIWTRDINKGQKFIVLVTVNGLEKIFFELKVDLGKNSAGGYSLIFSVKEPISKQDQDNDNLPDAWEIEHFETIENATATGDPDNDDLDNLGELNADTDPLDSDTDDDGLPDGWETQNDLLPTVDDSSLDPDSDGYTNLQEYKNQTDPIDPKSHPLVGFDHLTKEAVSRTYGDPSNDVKFWSGNYDSGSSVQTVTKFVELGNYPNYDTVSLSSERVNNDLVVKLKVQGQIQDLGFVDSGDGGSEPTEGAFYWVGFVDATFSEPTMDDKSGLVYTDPWGTAMKFTLMYVNKTFIGTSSSVGQKIDSGKGLEWKIPLTDIASLSADFKLFGAVYQLKINQGGAQSTFEGRYDSLGFGSASSGDNIVYPLEKSVEINGRSVSVSVGMDAPGADITIASINKPSASLPKDTDDMGIFLDISTTGAGNVKSVFIKMKYNDSDIPSGREEKEIKMFYYDTSARKWIKVSDSGVWRNNNTAWARLDHLTVFAPMTTKTGDQEDSTWMTLLLLMFILIIVVIVSVVSYSIIRSRRRRRARVEPPPRRRPQRALNPEFFACPRCDEEIEIPLGESKEIALECPNCGAEGRVDNPYLGRDDGGRPSRDRDDRRRSRDDYDEGYDEGYDDDYDQEYDSRSGRREPEGPRPPPPPRPRPIPQDDHKDRDEPELEFQRPPARDRRDDYEEEYDDDYEDEDEYDEESDEDIEDEDMGDEGDGAGDDYEFKECPKCHKEIAIPYEEDEKVLINCPYCGARGKVKNPYL